MSALWRRSIAETTDDKVVQIKPPDLDAGSNDITQESGKIAQEEDGRKRHQVMQRQRQIR
jgi:hypothetical protein